MEDLIVMQLRINKFPYNNTGNESHTLLKDASGMFPYVRFFVSFE
jgi:hypothetical protein